MDVVPALMHGVAQQVGVDLNEMMVILVGDEHQVEMSTFQTFQQQYNQVEWDYEKLNQHHNPEPYIEICLKQDVPLLQPYNTSQNPIAHDVKGSDRYTQRDRPVDLYQVGSYASCLSALRSRLVCAMEGEFVSKGAVKMGAVKYFQGGNHINKKVPESFAQFPLPLETFLHIQTWHSRDPTSGYHYALESDVSFAGVAGIAFNISTLSQHRWNAMANWSSSIAQTNLLLMYDKKGVVESTLRAMGLDHTRVPTTCDPGYRHTAASDDEAAAKAHADRMRAIMSGEAPPQLGAGKPHLIEVPQLPQSSGMPPQPACAASGPTRTGYAMNDQSSLVDPARVYKTPPTPADKPCRIRIPVDDI